MCDAENSANSSFNQNETTSKKYLNIHASDLMGDISIFLAA